MIDRRLARLTAELIAGSEPAGSAAPSDLAAICADAERRVVAYTGLRPARALPVAELVSRPEWIAANVNATADLLGPVAERMAGGAEAGPLVGLVRGAAGTLLSTEAGALTGYLAQRVLGQYDVSLAESAGSDGSAWSLPPRSPRLLFVEPNIGRAAVRLSAASSSKVDERELWTWIAVHEVTHAVQFAGVPWLRDHVAGLLAELLRSLEVSVDPAALRRLPGRENVRGLGDALRSGGIAAALAGPERRALLDRLQVTMAVVEGHAEHVMDIVGVEVGLSMQTLRTAMDRRRHERHPALRLLERLIGLEAKLRQYQDGKRFCDAVVAEAGTAALHSVFDAPERLPSPAELVDPTAWLARS